MSPLLPTQLSVFAPASATNIPLGNASTPYGFASISVPNSPSPGLLAVKSNPNAPTPANAFQVPLGVTFSSCPASARAVAKTAGQSLGCPEQLAPSSAWGFTSMIASKRPPCADRPAGPSAPPSGSWSENSPLTSGEWLPVARVIVEICPLVPKQGGPPPPRQTSPPCPASATVSVPFGKKARPRGLSRPDVTGVTVAALLAATMASAARQATIKATASFRIISPLPNHKARPCTSPRLSRFMVLRARREVKRQPSCSPQVGRPKDTHPAPGEQRFPGDARDPWTECGPPVGLSGCDDPAGSNARRRSRLDSLRRNERRANSSVRGVPEALAPGRRRTLACVLDRRRA